MIAERSREADGIVARVVEDIVGGAVVAPLGVHPVQAKPPLAVARFEACRTADTSCIGIIADVRLAMDLDLLLAKG